MTVLFSKITAILEKRTVYYIPPPESFAQNGNEKSNSKTKCRLSMCSFRYFNVR